MSEFTADEYRTAAKVIAESQKRGGFPYATGAGVKWLNDQADRLEAESARDEYAEKLARVAVEADSELRWADLLPEDRADVIIQMRAVLNQLAADGRLLPESGELTEAVKATLTEALDTVLSAVGISTLPAVSVPDSGPDGTPEKPWPTWQDVPEGVTVQAKNRHFYTKRDGILCIGTSTMTSYMALSTDHLAPFVRVDGGTA